MFKIPLAKKSWLTHPLVQRAKTYSRENREYVTGTCIHLLMCAFFFSTTSEPTEPVVKQVLGLVQSMGLVAVFVLPLIVTVIEGFSRRTAQHLASRFLCGLAFYSMALWIIGHSGNDVYHWLLANPKDVAIGFAAVVIVWAIVYFSRGFSFVSVEPEDVAGSLGVAKFARNAIKPTQRDNSYTATHEAGHALVYAALTPDGLPADMRLVVHDSPDDSGVLGYVTGIEFTHHLNKMSFVEWYMLVLLAGKFGESVLHDESTMGSSNDHARWLSEARNYLANHNRGMYYADPKNKFEQEQNEAKLEALQNEQLAMLKTFFDLNIDVFKQLTDHLLETRSMGRDDLIPFLSKVKIPDGFPCP